MAVYAKATAVGLKSDVKDVISTAGGKEIVVFECIPGPNGSQTGSTSKECYYDGSITV